MGQIKNEEKTSCLCSFPLLDVLSGGFLSKCYLSYCKFLNLNGNFLEFFTGSRISIRNRDTDLNFWPDTLFLLLIQKNQRGSGKKKRTKTLKNVPHRTENLLGIYF
jgi:hypothetical protein